MFTLGGREVTGIAWAASLSDHMLRLNGQNWRQAAAEIRTSDLRVNKSRCSTGLSYAARHI